MIKRNLNQREQNNSGHISCIKGGDFEKMKIPKRLLFTKDRKNMWKNASRLIKYLDSNLNFSEIYVIGSFVSNKKRPADIDFTIVTKMKNKSSSWPIDLVLVPEGKDIQYYLDDIKKWMKSRYGRACVPIKIK